MIRNNFSRHLRTNLHEHNEKIYLQKQKAAKQKKVEDETEKNQNWKLYTKQHPWLVSDPSDSAFAYCKYCEKRIMYGSSAAKRATHENSSQHKQKESEFKKRSRKGNSDKEQNENKSKNAEQEGEDNQNENDAEDEYEEEDQESNEGKTDDNEENEEEAEDEDDEETNEDDNEETENEEEEEEDEEGEKEKETDDNDSKYLFLNYIVDNDIYVLLIFFIQILENVYTNYQKNGLINILGAKDIIKIQNILYFAFIVEHL